MPFFIRESVLVIVTFAMADQGKAIPLPSGIDPATIDPNVVAVVAVHHQQHQDDLGKYRAKHSFS